MRNITYKNVSKYISYSAYVYEQDPAFIRRQTFFLKTYDQSTRAINTMIFFRIVILMFYA